MRSIRRPCPDRTGHAPKELQRRSLDHVPLEKWLTRLELRADDSAQIGSEAGVIVDPACARKVARCCYDNAIQSGSSAWLRAEAYEPVDAAYAACFGAAPC